MSLMAWTVSSGRVDWSGQHGPSGQIETSGSQPQGALRGAIRQTVPRRWAAATRSTVLDVTPTRSAMSALLSRGLASSS